MPGGKSSRCRGPDVDTHSFVFVRVNRHGGPPGWVKMSKWVRVTGGEAREG